MSGKAIVDLDIVRQKQSSGGWFDPTSYLTGKLPVTASGRIVTWDGKGKFELETRRSQRRADSRSRSSRRWSTSSRAPPTIRKGSSIDDTFELPADIRRIDVDASRLTVHQ